MAKQRISYVPLEKMDAAMRAEMERCQREGTPRRRARPSAPMCRPRSGSLEGPGTTSSAMARSTTLSRSCADFTCPVRSSANIAESALGQGDVASGALVEDQVMTFSTSRSRRATTSARRRRSPMRRRSCGGSRPTMRSGSAPSPFHRAATRRGRLHDRARARPAKRAALLSIEHHEVLAGTSASMAPGREDARKLAETKAMADDRAKSQPAAPDGQKKKKKKADIGAEGLLPSFQSCKRTARLHGKLGPIFLAAHKFTSRLIPEASTRAAHSSAPAAGIETKSPSQTGGIISETPRVGTSLE